ncbi:MAG: FdtA/QdtA family cupin domain-containing protein [Gammaproteobacteria bacterium]
MTLNKITTKTNLNVGSCELWPLPDFEDQRGNLMAIEFSKDLPFRPQREFFVHHVPSNKLRGEHAHKKCEQFLVAIHGHLSIKIDDGTRHKEVELNHPSLGLYIPANIWGIQFNFSSDAVLMVFASHPYDNDDYIRDYSEFINYVNQAK